MNLNHINLPVRDVAVSRDFFATYFGMVTTLEVGDNFLVMMQDEGSMVLNLSHFDNDFSTEIAYPKDFHIGFYVETNDDVDRIHAQMSADGLVADPPKRREGRYSFYVQSPGGFITEVAKLAIALQHRASALKS
jgi:catechol 2,3-dioxygenase-like lactoylglutathione lyase family enzyme